MTMIFAGAFMVATALIVLGFDDSHHNLKYVMWKHHLWSYNHLSLKYLNVDPAFRMSLIGKTRAEVERWFPRPILQPSDKADGYLRYCDPVVYDPEFCWIDGTRWGITFKRGKVTDIRYFKG